MTAQEFITAITAGGTIEVDTDIDFNDYYFSSAISIPTNTIINGNGHTLTNIQQGEQTVIFSSSGNYSWNNINIRNVNVPNGTLFNTTYTNDTYANDCQISGYIYRIHYGGSTSYYNRMIFNRCSLNINRYYEINATLRDCYVVLENNIIKGDNAPHRYFGKGINTYYKGKLSNANGKITVPSGSFDNCCINITIEGSAQNLVSLAGSGLISIVNSDKIEGVLSLDSNIVSVTDTEMHDAQSLFDKGFNIYVP